MMMGVSEVPITLLGEVGISEPHSLVSQPPPNPDFKKGGLCLVNTTTTIHLFQAQRCN